MKAIIEEFTAKLLLRQQEYDDLLYAASVNLCERIGNCSCSKERCIRCHQDALLSDRIEALLKENEK